MESYPCEAGDPSVIRPKQYIINQLRMIKDIVSKEEYEVWTNMLKTLVPYGRTHRLSVVIAGMLQYTYAVGNEKLDKCKNSRKFCEIVDLLSDCYDGEGTEELELYVIELFKDAEVEYERMSSRGDPYSIVENAIDDFIAWENMPWE